jgi:L-ribulose-5-phosphate 3-epimerase
MFKLGYNTNGFASHSLLSAIDIIADAGYQSVAVTIDHHSLNPWDDHLEQQINLVRQRLEKYQLSVVIETGARFLLDPGQKHEPTLVSAGKEKRALRIHFIKKCLNIASRLNADAVSIWSGKKAPDIHFDQAWEWLIAGCRAVCNRASRYGIPVAFEPEPGMMVENMEQYCRLRQAVDHAAFKLTLDVGHAFITEKSVTETLETFKDDIANIHLEDMKKRAHDHLFFGDGDMDFEKLFNTLNRIRYTGQVNVELSRHSHDAVAVSQRAMVYLERFKTASAP